MKQVMFSRDIVLQYCTLTVPLCSKVNQLVILDGLMNTPLRLMGGVYDVQ